MSLAVVTCHFNYARYKRPVLNLRRFLRQMRRDGISVYGVEIVFDGGHSIMRSDPNWKVFHCGPEGVMFQKEWCMNEAVKLVPSGFNNIACLDADVWFDNPNWDRDVERKLDRYKVVQPFEYALWTDQAGEVIQTRESYAKVGMSAAWKGHPGFGLCFRRDFFEIGMYPYAVLGHGDSATACATLKQKTFGDMRDGIGVAQYTNGIFRDWFESVVDYNDGKVAWIKGKCFHEWHGDRVDRGYNTRSAISKEFDAQTHLAHRPDGLPVWTAEAPLKMRKLIQEYFKSRNEDGIPKRQPKVKK